MAGEEILRVDVIFDVTQADREMQRLATLSQNIGKITLKAELGDVEAQVQRLRQAFAAPIPINIQITGIDSARNDIAALLGQVREASSGAAAAGAAARSGTPAGPTGDAAGVRASADAADALNSRFTDTRAILEQIRAQLANMFGTAAADAEKVAGATRDTASAATVSAAEMQRLRDAWASLGMPGKDPSDAIILMNRHLLETKGSAESILQPLFNLSNPLDQAATRAAALQAGLKELAKQGIEISAGQKADPAFQESVIQAQLATQKMSSTAAGLADSFRGIPPQLETATRDALTFDELLKKISLDAKSIKVTYDDGAAKNAIANIEKQLNSGQAINFRVQIDEDGKATVLSSTLTEVADKGRAAAVSVEQIAAQLAATREQFAGASNRADTLNQALKDAGISAANVKVNIDTAGVANQIVTIKNQINEVQVATERFTIDPAGNATRIGLEISNLTPKIREATATVDILNEKLAASKDSLANSRAGAEQLDAALRAAGIDASKIKINVDSQGVVNFAATIKQQVSETQRAIQEIRFTPGGDVEIVRTSLEAVTVKGREAAASAQDLASRLALARDEMTSARQRAEELDVALKEAGIDASKVKVNIDSQGLASFTAQVRTTVSDAQRLLQDVKFTPGGGIDVLRTSLEGISNANNKSGISVNELTAGLAGAAERTAAAAKEAERMKKEFADAGVEVSNLTVKLNAAGQVTSLTGKALGIPTGADGKTATVGINFDQGSGAAFKATLDQVAITEARVAATAADISRGIQEATTSMQNAKVQADLIKQAFLDAGQAVKSIKSNFDETGKLTGFTAKTVAQGTGDLSKRLLQTTFDAQANRTGTSVLDEDSTGIMAGKARILNAVLSQVVFSSGRAGMGIGFFAQNLDKAKVPVDLLNKGFIALIATSIILKGTLTFDNAVNTLINGVGAARSEVAGLANDLRIVGSQVPVSMQQAAVAFASVKRQFSGEDDGYSRGDQRELTVDLLKLNERLPGGSDDALNSQVKLINQYGLDLEEAKSFMDELAYSTQKYSGDLGRLTTDLRTAGPVLTSIGLSPEESIRFAAQFESVGINLSEVALGLNQFSATAHKSNISARDDLQRTISLIQEAGDAQTAAAIATDVFGSRNNQSDKIAAGIRGGGITLADLDTSESDGALENTEKRAVSLGGELKKLGNSFISFISIIGDPVVSVIKTLLSWVNLLFTGISKVWGFLSDVVGAGVGLIGKAGSAVKGLFESDPEEETPQQRADRLDKKRKEDEADRLKKIEKDNKAELEAARKRNADDYYAGRSDLTDDQFTAQFTENQRIRNAVAREGVSIDERKRRATIELALVAEKGNLTSEDSQRIATQTALSETQVAEAFEELSRSQNISTVSTGDLNKAFNSLLGSATDGKISLAEMALAARASGGEVSEQSEAVATLNEVLGDLGGIESEAGQRALAMSANMLTAKDALEGVQQAADIVKRSLDLEEAFGETFVPTLGGTLDRLDKGEGDDGTFEDRWLKGYDDQIDRLKDMKEALTDALDDQIDSIKDAADAQIDAIDAQIKAIEDQIKALDKLKEGTNNLTVEQRYQHESRLADLQAEDAALRGQNDSLNTNIMIAQSRYTGASAYSNDNPGDLTARSAAAQALRELEGLKALAAQTLPDINTRRAQIIAGIDQETAALRDQADAVRELTVAEQREAAQKRNDLSYQLNNTQNEIAALRVQRQEREAALKATIAQSDADPNAVGAGSRKLAAQQGLATLDEGYAKRLQEIQTRRGSALTEFSDNEAAIAGDLKAREIRRAEEAMTDDRDRLNDEKDAIKDRADELTDSLNDQKDAIGDSYDDQIEALEDQKDALKEALDKNAKETVVSIQEAFAEMAREYTEKQKILADVMALKPGNESILSYLFDADNGLSDEQRFAYAKTLTEMSAADRKALDDQAANFMRFDDDLAERQRKFTDYIATIQLAKDRVGGTLAPGLTKLPFDEFMGPLPRASWDTGVNPSTFPAAPKPTWATPPAERNEPETTVISKYVIAGIGDPTAYLNKQLSDAAESDVINHEQWMKLGRNVGENLASGLKDSGKKFLDAFKLAYTVKALKEAEEEGKVTGRVFGEGVGDGANDAKPPSGSILPQAVSKSVLEIGPWGKAAGLEYTTKLGEAASEAARSLLPGAGASAANALATGTNNGADTIAGGNLITRLANAALTAARGALVPAGSQSADSFNEGFAKRTEETANNLLSRPIAAIRNLGRTIVRQFDLSMGNSSPSKEAARSAGHFVDGWVVGLDTHGSRIAGAVDQAVAPIRDMNLNGSLDSEVINRMVIAPNNERQTVQLDSKDIERIVSALRAGPDSRPQFVPRRPVGVR